MQQKTGLNKVTQFYDSGYNKSGGIGKIKKCTNDRHPYMRPAFWQNPTNHFWNSDLYSKESKEYFNDFITRQSQ